MIFESIYLLTSSIFWLATWYEKRAIALEKWSHLKTKLSIGHFKHAESKLSSRHYWSEWYLSNYKSKTSLNLSKAKKQSCSYLREWDESYCKLANSNKANGILTNRNEAIIITWKLIHTQPLELPLISLEMNIEDQEQHKTNHTSCPASNDNNGCRYSTALFTDRVRLNLFKS